MLNGWDVAVRNGSSSAHVLISQGVIELVHFHLGASVSFGAATADSISLAGSLPLLNTGTAVAGNANRFAVHDEDDNVLLTGVLSTFGGGGDVQTTAVAVTAGADQNLNGLTLRMGPSGLVLVEMSVTLQ